MTHGVKRENHWNRSLLFKCALLKMWHFLDLVCLVPIKTGLCYSNRSFLKKNSGISRPYMCTTCCNNDKRSGQMSSPNNWHFLDLACSVHVVTITTGLSYSNKSLLKKWHFPDLICAMHVNLSLLVKCILL